MSIVVTEPDQKDWERPEDGAYLGVIADVVDLGEVETGYGLKKRVRIVWLLDAFDSEGNQFRVMASYTASLHEKANLRKALKSILGADVSGQFDLEELLGVNNQVIVQTVDSGEKTYTNVIAILQAPKGKRLQIPADFVRKSDKDGEKKQAPKKEKPSLKQAAPKAPAQKPVPQQVEEAVVEQEAAEPVQQVAAPAPAPANRAGTIRQARTITPPVVAAPAKKAVNPAIAAARAALAAAEAAEAEAVVIDDSEIPF